MNAVFDSIGQPTLNVLLTVGLVGGAVLVRWLIVRSVRARVADTEIVFRTSKTVSYAITVLILAGLFRIWADQATDLVTFFGLVAAGLVIALSDIIKNTAGWLYILLRDPFGVGDRIKIGESAGDVIDIRLLRFSLMELSSWGEAGQSTGRIVHVPNGAVFNQPMTNATQGFEHMWHEMHVDITFESDWQRARLLLQEALESHSVDGTALAASEQLRKHAHHYLIRYGTLTPNVYVKTTDHSIRLTGRVLVPVRQRRGVDSAIWQHLLLTLAREPDIEFAYATTRIVRGGIHRTSPATADDSAEPTILS